MRALLILAIVFFGVIGFWYTLYLDSSPSSSWITIDPYRIKVPNSPEIVLLFNGDDYSSLLARFNKAQSDILDLRTLKTADEIESKLPVISDVMTVVENGATFLARISNITKNDCVTITRDEHQKIDVIGENIGSLLRKIKEFSNLIKSSVVNMKNYENSLTNESDKFVYKHGIERFDADYYRLDILISRGDLAQSEFSKSLNDTDHLPLSCHTIELRTDQPK